MNSAFTPTLPACIIRCKYKKSVCQTALSGCSFRMKARCLIFSGSSGRKIALSLPPTGQGFGHPGLVTGKKVAELAAGVGFPSLIAATYAQSVWCSDISAEAMEVAVQNASLYQLNNIQFEACNWNSIPASFDAEVVLLSDINYNPKAFGELEKVLTRLIQRGCTLLLATPQRLMAKPFLERLSGFIASSHEERVEANGQITFISIFILCFPKD
jgi:2-polyprenyl-3-methyl-5-hydroxy-6-metoxy-1,4-benzoquinol methylase